MGLQANNGRIGLDCYIDLRLEVNTGSRHSEGPKQPAQTTGQSVENFIKQDLPRGVILRAVKRERSHKSVQSSSKRNIETSRLPGPAGPHSYDRLCPWTRSRLFLNTHHAFTGLSFPIRLRLFSFPALPASHSHSIFVTVPL